MRSDEFKMELGGIDKLRAALADVSSKIRRRAVTSALRSAGQVIRKEAQAAAPVLQKPAPYRKAGTIKKNITVRTSKFARQAGNVGIYIGVRPLSGKRQSKLGKAGAKNPNDPFYWWFLEFGTKFFKPGQGLRFLSNAAKNKGQQAIETFMSKVVPQIERLNNRVR